MLNKPYFLSQNGAHIGPFSFGDILHKLETKEHQWIDYVYDDGLQDWVMLMEHPEFTEKFNASLVRPGSPPMPAFAKPRDLIRSEAKLRDKEWFLLREGNNYGPFSVLDVVQMLQEKTLFEFDYVWHQSMDAWKRVAEVPTFSADSIREMKDSKNSDVSEIFFRRRHPRARYGCSLIVHDNKAIFLGHTIEISEGGAGLTVGNAHLQPGQSLFLHFQPGDGVPPFNAVCSVVSKQWVEVGKTSAPPVKYGVRFTSLSQTIRESIRNYTNKIQAA